MQPSVSFTVQASEDGSHLDKFVAHHAQLSRRLARLLISQGSVTLNGKTVKILIKPLKTNDVVAWTTSTQNTPTQPAQTLQLLHIDRYCLVINKPSGLLSEHDRFGSPCIETLAAQWLHKKGEKTDLWLVHRLDAVTSGVIVLARTPMAVKELSACFRENNARKEYWALCAGVLSSPHTLQAPVGRIRGVQHGVVPEGKPAETAFEPLCHNPQMSLVIARPKTGRTHQIRVHLAHLQHPIMGDTLYGGPRYLRMPEKTVAVPRTMLHAHTLRIAHPKTGEPCVWTAPLPNDFVSLAEHAGYRRETLETK